MWDTYIVSNSADKRAEIRGMLVRYQLERNMEFHLEALAYSKTVPSFEEVGLFILDVSEPAAVDEKIAEIRKNARRSHIILLMKRLQDIYTLTLAPIAPVGILPWTAAYEQIRQTFDSLKLIDHSLDDFYVINAKGKSTRVHLGQILYFESRNKKTFLVTQSREFEIQDTMNKLADEMHETFLRAHRSYLVNKLSVHSFEAASNLLVLTDGTQIPVSRTYKEAVREVIAYY